MNPHKDVRGFTLIELLAALAIFAVVAGSLGAALRQGAAAWDRGRRSADLDQEARAALDQMARELRNAVSVPAGTLRTDGGGFTFYSVLFSDGGEDRQVPRIVRLTYRLTPEGASPRFLERLQGGYFDKEDQETPLRLTSFPTELSFQYAYAPDEQGLRWEDKWDTPGSFPGGIRVKLTLYEDASPVTFTKTILLPTGLLTPWKG